jgi:uncharacterized protein YodC (DUF2158 family)
MKKLIVIKKVVLWTLLLLAPVLYALSFYYGSDFASMSLGNQLYVMALEAIIGYDLLKDGFKFFSWLKSPERPIVAGDVVKLKSGGPRMVVDAEHYTGSLYCRWFDGNKTLESAFPQKALKLA